MEINFHDTVTKNPLRRYGIAALAVSLLISAVFLPAPGLAQAPFYQGKTITVIATTSPGGTGDIRVKALLPYLRKHIPGNPTMIMEYMDGGGGRKGANYLYRNARPDGLDKGEMNFHAILEVLKGAKHPRLGHLPEVETFAKSDREKKLLAMWRVFRLVGSPYIVPPGTPKNVVDTLHDGFRKALKDHEFHKDFLKLVGDDAEPLMPEELTQAIRDVPRDVEVTEMIKTLSGAGPLPAR